jgi:hypothetical protein
MILIVKMQIYVVKIKKIMILLITKHKYVNSIKYILKKYKEISNN